MYTAPPRPGRTWLVRGGRVYGARPGPLGPTGGGAGYARIVRGSPHHVRTLDGLLAALKRALPGSVVFVEGNAVIDCTVRVLVEKRVLEIPAGVTLASDRGARGSSGALIFSDAHATRPLIRALGPGVRITGLRLRGPDPRPRWEHHRRAVAGRRGPAYYYRYPVSEGIQTRHDRLEVDNCELAGWTHAAVLLEAGVHHHIHHNHIHHNLFRGLGYGVALRKSRALVEHNLLHQNRHSVAASGVPDSGYEARHNVELGGGQSHCFDMHGGADRKDGTDVAGSWIHIHHNTFRRCRPAIAIRGTPQRPARVHHNWFSHPTPHAAVRTGGNTRVRDNAYGTTRPRIR